MAAPGGAGLEPSCESSLKPKTGEAFEEEGRSSSSLLLSIHRSAWKWNSANFAFWGFSEVAPGFVTPHTYLR
jgi:hypothetical protein